MEFMRRKASERNASSTAAGWRPLVAGYAMMRRCAAARNSRADRRYGTDAGDYGEGSPNSRSFIHPRRQANSSGGLGIIVRWSSSIRRRTRFGSKRFLWPSVASLRNAPEERSAQHGEAERMLTTDKNMAFDIRFSADVDSGKRRVCEAMKCMLADRMARYGAVAKLCAHLRNRKKMT